MRQLIPEPREGVIAVDLYTADARSSTSDRPWLVVNMVASVDGATALEGRSGGLGGPADRSIFHALRGVADVILVGAGTARAEQYRPPNPSTEIRAERLTRGQSECPRLAIVSSSLELDPTASMFVEGRPIVITHAAADQGRRAALESVADIVVAGETAVDLVAALTTISPPTSVVVCEGGPTLNGQLTTDRLVDELCLTISPLITAGQSHRLVNGDPVTGFALTLDRALEEEGSLFLRYVRS